MLSFTRFRHKSAPLSPSEKRGQNEMFGSLQQLASPSAESMRPSLHRQRSKSESTEDMCQGATSTYRHHMWREQDLAEFKLPNSAAAEKSVSFDDRVSLHSDLASSFSSREQLLCDGDDDDDDDDDDQEEKEAISKNYVRSAESSDNGSFHCDPAYEEDSHPLVSSGPVAMMYTDPEGMDDSNGEAANVKVEIENDATEAKENILEAPPECELGASREQDKVSEAPREQVDVSASQEQETDLLRVNGREDTLYKHPHEVSSPPDDDAVTTHPIPEQGGGPERDMDSRETPLKRTGSDDSPGVLVPDNGRRSVVAVLSDTTDAEDVYEEQQGREQAGHIPRQSRGNIAILLMGDTVTVPEVNSMVVRVQPRRQQQQQHPASQPAASNHDAMAEVYREMFDRCSPPYLRGFIDEIFRLLGIPRVEGVQFGCLELLLQMLTPAQAHALLQAHASGKLQTALSKILLGENEDEYELVVDIAEEELRKLAQSRSTTVQRSSSNSDDSTDEDMDFLEKLEHIVTAHRRAVSTPNHHDNGRSGKKAPPRREKRKHVSRVYSDGGGDSPDDDVQKAATLYKSMPLIEVPKKFRRRQEQLSGWLQKLVESPHAKLPHIMSSLKAYYNQHSSTTDEIVLIELKGGLWALYRADLHAASCSLEEAARHLCHTSQPSYLTMQLLLTQAERQRTDRHLGSLNATITDMKQLALQLSAEDQGSTLLTEARYLLHCRALMRNNSSQRELDEQIRHNLDRCLMYFNDGGNPSNLARSLILRCMHHLQFSSLDRSATNNEDISSEDLERTWHCLKYFESRLKPEERTRRIDCYYQLVLSDYSYRAHDYERAMAHAQTAFELAQGNQFVTLRRDCEQRRDNLQQLLDTLAQRQQILTPQTCTQLAYEADSESEATFISSSSSSGSQEVIDDVIDEAIPATVGSNSSEGQEVSGEVKQEVMPATVDGSSSGGQEVIDDVIDEAMPATVGSSSSGGQEVIDEVKQEVIPVTVEEVNEDLMPRKHFQLEKRKLREPEQLRMVEDNRDRANTMWFSSLAAECDQAIEWQSSSKNFTSNLPATIAPFEKNDDRDDYNDDDDDEFSVANHSDSGEEMETDTEEDNDAASVVVMVDPEEKFDNDDETPDALSGEDCVDMEAFDEGYDETTAHYHTRQVSSAVAIPRRPALMLWSDSQSPSERLRMVTDWCVPNDNQKFH